MAEPAASLSPPATDEVPNPTAGERVLDPAVIEQIREMQQRGAADLLSRLRVTFIDSSARLVASIDAAIDAEDREALRCAAHTLKSASGNVGATRFSRCCAELETLARTATLDEARAHWHGVCADYARVVSALAELETDIAAA